MMISLRVRLVFSPLHLALLRRVCITEPLTLPNEYICFNNGMTARAIRMWGGGRREVSSTLSLPLIDLSLRQRFLAKGVPGSSALSSRYEDQGTTENLKKAA